MRTQQTVLLMLLPLFVFASDFQTPAITAQDLHTRQGGTDTLLVIDVRAVAEYKSGHVPGAINIPQKKLERQLDQLLDADGVVLYCINGRRTRLAEQTLIENDVPNVFHLEGGLMGWRQGGFKVRTGWGPYRMMHRLKAAADVRTFSAPCFCC
jgi:rhodanese-related sulfurtransferase